jgi:hypothetical protein
MARSAVRRSSSIAERQATKLLEKISITLEGAGRSIGKAATAAAKRKYLMAALAAVAIAGAAAGTLRNTLVGGSNRTRIGQSARKKQRSRRTMRKSKKARAA